MSDFYKKFYGYEDEIQLKDDDITTLETGMNLRKMNQSKEEFNQRFYRLDLKNNQLIASTKEFRKKEKLYPLINLNEVKIGCSSDNLKYYKLKKIVDKRKADEMEKIAFVITFDNYRKTLDLLAPNEIEQNRWVRVLSYFIILTKKRKGVLPEADTIMRNYFELSDTNNDNKLNETEVTAFLDSINLKLKKDQLRTLIRQADQNNDGILGEEEFEQFLLRLYQRREMKSLFKLLIIDGQSIINFTPEYMSVSKLKRFLKHYQLEDMSDQECKDLILKYELEEDCKMNYQFSLGGFVNYLNDQSQHISSPIQDKIYQNMNLPIFNYFINSSHNTYLSGDQLTSTSSADCYRAAIMNGARLVEMDVYDSDDMRPRIFHQKTLTTKILFEDALIVCKEYAFKLTEYPLIITIELHCSPSQQKVMALLIKKHLGEFLYTDEYDPNLPFPTLNQLKRKILIRCQKPKKIKENSALIQLIHESNEKLNTNLNDDFVDDDEEEEDDEKTTNRKPKDFEQIKELGDLLNLMQNTSFKGIDYAFKNYKQNQTSSLAEKKCQKVLKSESPQKIIAFTSNFLTKVYPSVFRSDSSNLDMQEYLIYGFQIAALNFQTNDNPMIINNALFNDNGKCGFVLKPEILRNPAMGFNPNDLNTMKNKKVIDIKVISAQELPQNNNIVKDISDPFVIISVFGVEFDRDEKKTKAVKDNGFNPIWNEDFKFIINCPELAFLKFEVKDQDFGRDQLIGDFAIRFENIRSGYRHFKLNNKHSKGSLFVGIKIQPFQSLSELIKIQ